MILNLLLTIYLIGVIVFYITQYSTLKEEKFSLPWTIALSIFWPLVLLDFVYFLIFVDKDT